MTESIRAYLFCNHEAITDKPVKISYSDKTEYWHWVARECLYHRKDRPECQNLRYIGHQLGFNYAETRSYEKIGDEDRKNYNLYILCKSVPPSNVTKDIFIYLWLNDWNGRKLLVPCGKTAATGETYLLDIFQYQAMKMMSAQGMELNLLGAYEGNDLFKIREVTPHLTVDEFGSEALIFYCESSTGKAEQGLGKIGETKMGLTLTLLLKWPGVNGVHVYPLSEMDLQSRMRWSTRKLQEYLLDCYVPSVLRERMEVTIWKGDLVDKVEPVEASSSLFLPELNQETIWVRVEKKVC